MSRGAQQEAHAKSFLDGRLSPHLTWREFLHSEAAIALGDSNLPTEKHKRNAELYLAPGFEWIRSVAGCPVFATSGYRNPRVNAAVGGVVNSAHALGLAIDVRTARHSCHDLASLLAHRMPQYGGPVDQIIKETSRGIVHVSFDPRNRRQVLTQPGGPGTPCRQGLV